MCQVPVSCAGFIAILTPFMEPLSRIVKTVWNNFTKQHQNGFEIGKKDRYGTHLRYETFVSNEIASYTSFFFFLQSVISHMILYILKLSHTPRVLGLGSLCVEWSSMVYPRVKSSDLFLVFGYMTSNFMGLNVFIQISILDSHCHSPKQEVC